MTYARTLALALAVGLLLSLGRVPPTAAQDEIAKSYQKSYEHEARAELVAALSALETIPKTAQNSYVFLLRHGWLLYLNARYPESIASYRAAIQRDPKAIEPRLGLTLPQMALRQWQAVVQTAEGILQIDPLQTVTLTRLALAQYHMGGYPEAEANYRKVSALYPSDVDMQAGIGFCQLGRGAPQQALKTFQAALLYAPRDARLRDGIATARAALSGH